MEDEQRNRIIRNAAEHYMKKTGMDRRLNSSQYEEMLSYFIAAHKRRIVEGLNNSYPQGQEWDDFLRHLNQEKSIG